MASLTVVITFQHGHVSTCENHNFRTIANALYYRDPFNGTPCHRLIPLKRVLHAIPNPVRDEVDLMIEAIHTMEAY